jgi:uridine kinase
MDKELKLNSKLKAQPPKNGKFYTIAVDGRGGSGKSTLTKYIAELLPEFIVLNGDDYFEPTDGQVSWGIFNDERFINDVIKPISKSNKFVYKPYDWHSYPHISERTIEVSEGLCLERCYSFLFELDWDLKIWVDTPKEECLSRGLKRESMPRERVLIAWKEWQTNEDDYISDYNPSTKADIILSGLLPFEKQLT